jgi:hypothetical protein
VFVAYRNIIVDLEVLLKQIARDRQRVLGIRRDTKDSPRSWVVAGSSRRFHACSMFSATPKLCAISLTVRSPRPLIGGIDCRSANRSASA